MAEMDAKHDFHLICYLMTPNYYHGLSIKMPVQMVEMAVNQDVDLICYIITPN